MSDIHIVRSAREVSPDHTFVVPIFKGQSVDDIADLPDFPAQVIGRLLEGEGRLSKSYESTLLYAGDSEPNVFLVGAGDQDAWSGLVALRVASAASRYLTSRGFTRLALVGWPQAAEGDHLAWAQVEGSIVGAYNPALKKTADQPRSRLDDVTIAAAEIDRAREHAQSGQVVGEAKNMARDLVNLPPNEINPTTLSDRARSLAKEHGLECDVLDETAMRQLGMGSLLGVAAGSRQPPRLIALRYGNQGAAVRLAVVGKGLTFDSGGLSLKTAEGMETMKGDMAGAAAVVAGMVAIARLAPQGIAVTGYVGATENMPGGAAMRPGDVLTALNGKTIEVLNTDAEGRLVLADVLAYATRQGATHIVDFATLTGAAFVALGGAASLATGRPMDWVHEVAAAADEAYERAWPMPQYPEYREAMDSELADLKNTGGRGGGALNAAAFLSEFVDDVPWTHMDIAGTAFDREVKPYRAAGATGEGVGTIVSLATRLAGI